MTACTDRCVVAGGSGSEGFFVGDAEGLAEVCGDELPWGLGEEEGFGEADADELGLFPSGVADPLTEGVAKEIRPPAVSSSDSVCP
ncbi:hypothetical protein [Streptomyces sp. NBC_01235]|uniref:hypothetical protein n=1 Tax=Streptomyces sp. NBC_01235 TaxID=2903788 RepID=UPI002E0F5266